jgi:plastocyanin
MNAFLIAGAVLTAWAVIVSALGMRGFPRNRGAERAAILITAILFVGAVGSAIADQTKVGERKGPEKKESGAEPKAPVEGAAPAEKGQGGGTAAGDQGAAKKPTSLALSADPSGALKFDTAALDAAAGPVTIVMTNTSAVPHNVSIKGAGVDQHGNTVENGGKSTVTAGLKPGAYEFYCSVPGHEQAGMKGTLTVK